MKNQLLMLYTDISTQLPSITNVQCYRHKLFYNIFTKCCCGL